ncbi:MAG TPA: C25 family cysteine peptidase [Bacteroidales bacterium]|nr:C25 family cysteine peptidase [Bacteroidales bacterium]
MRLGKDKQAILLIAFLLLSASLWGQAGKSYKYQLDGNLQKIDVLTSNHLIEINYSISELNIESILNENGSFYKVSIPDHTPGSIPGKPELPVFSRLISIPEGSEYKVKISEVRSSRIIPSRKKIKGILFPVQESETKEFQQKKPEFVIDKSLYSATGIISSDTVRIESLGTVRNKKLAVLYVSPVRYNPHSNLLEVITSMKIEILFSYPESIDSKSLISKSTLFNKSLEKGVLNYDPGDVIPGYSDQPVKMVIITDTAFRQHLEPFIKWKTQKGYKLQVLYKGAELAGDTYTQLKDTLTKIYNASSDTNPAPEYLLIIGDVSRIPYYGTGNVTDMYYGEFDGDGDYIPEMFIGRLPVADTTELKSVVKKLIQYEKFEFADTNKFYSQAIVSAGCDASYANTMNGQIKYAISNYLTPENKIEEHHFYYFSDLSGNDPEAGVALLARKDSIINYINEGVSFINYTGHGVTDGWSRIDIKVADTAKFTNKNMYPFIISNACQTSQFEDPYSFGNRLVVSDNKGAIGFIGCSNDSYWNEDFYWSVGLGTVSANPTYLETGMGSYDRLFHTHDESPSDWYFTMGQINYAGNLSVSTSTSRWKKYYWETYNLVGDPSVIPIIGIPDSFNIILPDTLPNGITSFSTDIPPFAYIAVSHFDTLWDASYASPSGSVVLDMPGLSNDSCMVVITGQNKVPIIKTIYFSDVTDEFINLTLTSINDSLENNDGLADFGETFYLNLLVSNLGLTDAHELYAKISSTSDWITIISDSAYIGTLAARSDMVLDNDIEITISDDVPDKEVITINLVLKDLNSENHYTIDICAHAPVLEIISCTMDDSMFGNGDYIADPGENYNLVFKVRNYGSSDISGDFYVISQNSDLNIIDTEVKSGILKFGEITNIPISVKLSETVSSGSFIAVSSTLDCTPYNVTKDFTFRVGKIRESFEEESFSIFPWINISSKPWIITETDSYDGSISARSGAITHNGSSSLVIRTEYVQADSIKFLYKVSSEYNYDFLIFKLNDVEIFRKSGEISWEKKAVSVPEGYNKMEWIFSMDGAIVSGSNCAWIDLIDFAESGSVNYIQKDLQVLKISTPVQKDIYRVEPVTASILNLGSDTINGFWLAYEINDNYPIKEFFGNSIIPYGDTVKVSFKTKADLSKYGIYKINAYGVDNNDDYIINDTASITIENTEIIDALRIFPNPFINQFTIIINSRVSDKLKISITNAAGVNLYNDEEEIFIGKNEIIISDIRLIPSLYYLNLRGESINKTVPLLKITK